MQATKQRQIIIPITHSALQDSKSMAPSKNQTLPQQDVVNSRDHHYQQHNSKVKGNTQELKTNLNTPATSSQTIKLKHLTKHYDQNNAKLSQIIKRRKELDHEMFIFKYQEQQSKQKSQKGFDRNMRSQITQQEKISIKKALEAQKQLEVIAKLKEKQLQNKIQQKELQKKKQMNERLESSRIKNKNQALKRLQQMKLNQMEREKEKRQRNNDFQYVKHQTFLHEKFQQKWKQQQKIEEAKNKELLEDLKRKKQFSIKDIVKHEIEYKNFLSNNNESRKQKIKQQSLQKESIQKMTLSKYSPSKFLKTIFEQEQKMKMQQRAKHKQIANFITKKNQFAETIKQRNKTNLVKKQHLFPIKQNSNIQSQSKKRKTSKQRSLSQIQLMNIGNDYMRQIHSSIGHIQNNDSNVKTKDKNEEQNIIDYLKDLREKREKRNKTNPEVKQIRQLKHVMKKNLSKNQKFYQVKLIANRLETRTDCDTQMLLKSISTKITIINQFLSK